LTFILQNVDRPPVYPSGAVIDARGLNSTNTSMTCTASPWAGISNPPPSTILLPATGGATPNPIIIPNSSPWILASNTHLIGEGDALNDSPSGTVSDATTLQDLPDDLRCSHSLRNQAITRFDCPSMSDMAMFQQRCQCLREVHAAMAITSAGTDEKR
jgi:hypothetical protein